MNELVQRLKLQAGINDNPDQEGLDLFAELIVRECVKVCDDLDIDDWGDKSFDDGTYYCSRAIKQHFEVEE